MDILTGNHQISVTTVILTGRLDALEAAPLRTVLNEHIINGQINIAIDLTAVEFVDSAGLAALVKGMKDTRRAGGDLKLVAPRAQDAVRVFELTRFDRVFEMATDIDSLLADW